MVQEYLSIDEAADELGVTKDELNRMAQRREIRAFADRGSWKFRKKDVEEHARQAGIGSGAEVELGDSEEIQLPIDSQGSSDEILLSEHIDSGPSRSGARVIGMDTKGRTPSDSDVRLVAQGRSKRGSDSDVKLVPGAEQKSPSDSDVRLVSESKPPSDSDVKLAGPAPSDSDVRLERPKAPSDSGIRLSTEGISPPPGSDVTQDLPVFSIEEEDIGLSPSRQEMATSTDIDSDFDLSPAVDVDSAFELNPGGDTGSAGDSGIALASDDDIGLLPADDGGLVMRGGDVTAGSPSASGVNLTAPADSGISLDEPPTQLSTNVRAAKAKPGSDLFETDFEVPVFDEPAEASSSGDATEVLADSDFELSDAGVDLGGDFDSDSQVLSLEGEEPVDESAATAMSASPVDDETSEGGAGSGGDWEEDIQSGEVSTEQADAMIAAVPGDDSGHAPAPAMAPAAAATAVETEWGGFVVGTLSVGTFFMLIIGMMMADLMRTMWGWGDGNVTLYSSSILNTFKSMLGW